MTCCTINGGRVPIRCWTNPHRVEPAALAQLKVMASLPWVAHHVAVMPDVHVGKGATVGTVLAMRDAIAPAAVGVDIGCGMTAVETSATAEHLPDNLRSLRLEIERAIPTGKLLRPYDATSASDAEAKDQVQALFHRFTDLRAPVNRLRGRAALQVGSLGGGNHFIEVCLDTRGKVWLLLHSGSRNIGAALAEHHMLIAERLHHNRALRDPQLGVFLADTPEFAAYRHDLYWAQEYAALNRAVMMARLKSVVRRFIPTAEFHLTVTCHHNYVAEEHHFGEFLMVTRKGAIRARAGELGIIPGSMGTKSYIVRGLGNPLAFESASHGAGRRMSRGQARESLRLHDLVRQTQGVECRKDHGVIDEAPKAYKNIDRVMDEQRDLVEIHAELKQVICVKG